MNRVNPHDPEAEKNLKPIDLFSSLQADQKVLTDGTIPIDIKTTRIWKSMIAYVDLKGFSKTFVEAGKGGNKTLLLFASMGPLHFYERFLHPPFDKAFRKPLGDAVLIVWKLAESDDETDQLETNLQALLDVFENPTSGIRIFSGDKFVHFPTDVRVGVALGNIVQIVYTPNNQCFVDYFGPSVNKAAKLGNVEKVAFLTGEEFPESVMTKLKFKKDSGASFGVPAPYSSEQVWLFEKGEA